jgi:hypothetical protein
MAGFYATYATGLVRQRPPDDGKPFLVEKFLAHDAKIPSGSSKSRAGCHRSVLSLVVVRFHFKSTFWAKQK